jgi:hypothetical protein
MWIKHHIANAKKIHSRFTNAQFNFLVSQPQWENNSINCAALYWQEPCKIC